MIFKNDYIIKEFLGTSFINKYIMDKVDALILIGGENVKEHIIYKQFKEANKPIRILK